MVFSSQQLSKTHSISSYKTNLVVDDKSLERIQTTKSLGLHINEHLTRHDHIRSLSSACYSTLVTLRKIKNFTTFYQKKLLVEQLRFCQSWTTVICLVFNPLPDYLLKRLQKNPDFISQLRYWKICELC